MSNLSMIQKLVEREQRIKSILMQVEAEFQYIAKNGTYTKYFDELASKVKELVDELSHSIE